MDYRSFSPVPPPMPSPELLPTPLPPPPSFSRLSSRKYVSPPSPRLIEPPILDHNPLLFAQTPGQPGRADTWTVGSVGKENNVTQIRKRGHHRTLSISISYSPPPSPCLRSSTDDVPPVPPLPTIALGQGGKRRIVCRPSTAPGSLSNGHTSHLVTSPSPSSQKRGCYISHSTTAKKLISVCYPKRGRIISTRELVGNTSF